jgi:transcriptional regulator with XRE-family HTH domain
MPNNCQFSIFFKEKRLAAGLSQSELSTKLGYTGPQFISNLERGISQMPISKLPILADIFEIPVLEFVEIIVKEHAKELRNKIEKTLSKKSEPTILSTSK